MKQTKLKINHLNVTLFADNLHLLSQNESNLLTLYINQAEL